MSRQQREGDAWGGGSVNEITSISAPSFRRSSPTQQTKSKGLNLGGMGAMYGPGMGMMGKKR